MTSTMLVATVKKIVVTGAMMSTMSVAAIFCIADVNGTSDYYHYTDGPKCVHGYNDLPSHCYCGFL
jgi:hypothetical protein